MKKWLVRILAVIIGLPVLAGLILGGMILAGVDVLSWIPAKEWATRWAVTYLEDNYGVALEYDDVSLDFFSGAVAITGPRLYDSENREAGPFLTAGEFKVQIRPEGETYVLQSLQGDELALPVPMQENSPLMAVLQRNAPEDLVAQISDSLGSVPSRYDDQSLNLDLQQLSYSRSGDSITLEGLSVGWSGIERPMIQLQQLAVAPLTDAQAAYRIEPQNLRLAGTRVADDRYDLTDFIEVVQESMDSGESTGTEAEPRGLEDLELDRFSLALYNGAATVTALETVNTSIGLTRPGVELNQVRFQQGGNPVLNTDRLRLAFASDWALERIELSNPTLNLTEDGDGHFNMTDGITNVLSALNIPMEEGGSSESTLMPSITTGTTQLTYTMADGRRLNATIEELNLSGTEGQLRLGPLEATVEGVEHPSSIAFARFSGEYDPPSALTEWSSIEIDRISARAYYTSETMQPVGTLAELTDLPTRIKEELGLSAGDAPIRVDSLRIRGQDVQLTDYQLEEPVVHQISSIEWDWEDIRIGPSNPPMGDFRLAATLARPSSGTFGFDGKVSPEIEPANMEGTIAFSLDNLEGYEPYYRGQLPVRLDTAGLNITGDIDVDNDQLVSTVDVQLVQPQFSKTEGTGSFDSLNQTIALSAINGIKNSDGDIIVNENRIEGDLNNPEFKPGITLFDVLGRNLLKFIVNTPGLITDPVGTGQALIGGAAGALGDVLGGTAGGVGNLLQGLTGGRPGAATEAVAPATGESASATVAPATSEGVPNPVEEVGNALRNLFGGNRD